MSTPQKSECQTCKDAGYLRHPYCPECLGGKMKSEGDRMREIGASLGWTDIHGGPEDGGAYWRGTPPGSKRVVACPDWLNEPSGADLSKEAYKDLLTGPMPTCPREYRLNIIMVYMMGQASAETNQPSAMGGEEVNP